MAELVEATSAAPSQQEYGAVPLPAQWPLSGGASFSTEASKIRFTGQDECSVSKTGLRARYIRAYFIYSSRVGLFPSMK